MEFFVCTCPASGHVILDGNDQGLNRDGFGRTATKLCNAGRHSLALKCKTVGKSCTPALTNVLIEYTNPIAPLEVAFQCGSFTSGEAPSSPTEKNRSRTNRGGCSA